MEMDPTYESEEMETNMESMFEHVIGMSNTDMPRDFLASLSRHFFREAGEKFTTFQKLQTEACLLLEQRRPHWRKRKAKSASQFLSMFYILEKEVLESEDQVTKSLFVEAFHSRESYVEAVMHEFDKTDKIERKMTSGPAIKVPGFMYDDDDLEEITEETSSPNAGFDIDNCVLEISDIIEDLDKVDQSKYVKLFEKDSEYCVGIHSTRIKGLAKRKSVTLSPFPSNVKSYLPQVKSATKTFTKLTATSSVGATNTAAGYCMLINIKYLSLESRSRILTVLDREDVQVDAALEDLDATLSEESDLLPSQDFPNMFQSQTADTLLHCTLCEYLSRSKVEFEQHLAMHPTCDVCKQQLESESGLRRHMVEKHPRTNIKCNTCGRDMCESELGEHMKEHELFENFKKVLERNPKPTPKSKSRAKSKAPAKKKTVNCYLVFVDEHRQKFKEDNPTLSAIEITKKLSESWKDMSTEEKNRYKVKAAAINREENVDEETEADCPKCGNKFPSKDAVIVHILADHATTQSTVNKCKTCGHMFLTVDRLQEHMRREHNEATVGAHMEVDSELDAEEGDDEDVSNNEVAGGA